MLDATRHTKTVISGCTHFAYFGTAIRKNKLNIPCRPVAGAWLVHHPDGQRVLGIGHQQGSRISANEASFHMWVQTETHIIDFMSPLYPEIFREAHSEAPIPRLMLQVPREDDAKDIGEFLGGTPLLALPDVEMTKSLVERMEGNFGTQDFHDAILWWWSLLEDDPEAGISMERESGEFLEMLPSEYTAEGIWEGPGVLAHST